MRRIDAPRLDLRRFLPGWAAGAVGIPGHSSFARLREDVAGIAEHRARVARLSDDELRDAGRDWRRRGRVGPAPSLLALIEEATRRTLGWTPYEGQLLAAIALSRGFAVELDTGEGKTLAGAMAAALHALAGRSVHVLSVNDYLAGRDAQWMGPLLGALGIDVAWIGQASTAHERRDAYRAPVVYAPVTEVGYDVLRDRQATGADERVEPRFDVAIVDEADAVMIDEAMTPLVLAGASDEGAEDLSTATELVRSLEPDAHYAVDEDRATVALTDAGLDLLEGTLGVNLFASEHAGLLTRINLALHARVLMRRDVDYLVVDDGIHLVNSARGRVAQQQRWPDGLHAAIEAKEAVPITPPGIVLDTLTVQDLLLTYRTLSGMSGTVLPVADELMEFYGLPSGRVERHRPNRRTDEPTRVLASRQEKDAAIVEEILRRHEAGQPVLVGTQTVAESEELAARLPARVGARVLNARNDAEEAEVVARAGERGAITVSTQMSGRGTDIRLGGADERDRDRVVAAGGLAVIATSVYPSRRLDLQLRGRAGRQGDPGVSLAFASLEDEVVVANLTARWRRRIARPAAVPDSVRRTIVHEAQGISEAVRLGRHRSTWQYSRALTAQRTKVLAVREDVLRGSRGWLDAAIAGPVGALASVAATETVDRAVTLIALHHLDRRWSDHVAVLSELRDGIHLRALAGQNPADEFHRLALREFEGFFDVVAQDVAASLRDLETHGLDDPLRSLGLRRPSATWTYMIRDNPLGDPAGRAAEGLRSLLRGERRRH
ncbi:protein translocase subunit SecA 2 [Microbacterium album]|uniref:Protein translocase subunit SecA n=2 Tax=Microbacterium album TaxID=2053191 RepID=A0A917MKT9_9MICO|nr:protein translocase subunit SecA 2 [Microbacterium album]